MTEIHEYNLALKATGRSSEVCPLTVVVSLGTGLIPVTQVGFISYSLYLKSLTFLFAQRKEHGLLVFESTVHRKCLDLKYGK
jgi:hypothetical protein